MASIVNFGLDFTACDVSGQKPYAVKNFRPDATVGELVKGLVTKMGLAANDPSGRPHSYHAFLKREGRHLNSSQIVGDVLKKGDEIVLQPDIQAGGV